MTPRRLWYGLALAMAARAVVLGGVSGAARQTGTASLSGTVVEAGTGAVLRGARVVMSRLGAGTFQRGAVTDDLGHFTLDGLPAGRFILTAARMGYVTIDFGQTTAQTTGTPIDLVPGQALNEITLPLPRGAVLTGTVVDANGEAAPLTPVQALRYERPFGERQLVEVARASTDDRGEYRLYGLVAGEYVVAVLPTVTVGDLGTTTHETASLAAVLARHTPAADRLRAFLAAPPASPTSRPVGYAPVFYPGTALPAEATAILLKAGEERGAVNVQLQLVGQSRLEGVVMTPDGVTHGTIVCLVDTSRPGRGTFSVPASVYAAGRFAFTQVFPGTYTLVARQQTPIPGQDPSVANELRWGRTPVEVAGRDVLDLAVTLELGVTVSGHLGVASDGSGSEPSMPPAVQIALQTDEPTSRSGVGPPQLASPNRDGAFVLTNAFPQGKCWLEIRQAADITMRSAKAAGHVVADAPMIVRSGKEITDLSVTLSARATEARGTLEDRAGRPVAGNTIVIFPTESAYWTPHSRRIQAVRTGTAGTYVVAGLPAGRYRLAAVLDVEPGLWFDRSFLDSLVPASLLVTLGDGEHTEANLRIAARPPF